MTKSDLVIINDLFNRERETGQSDMKKRSMEAIKIVRNRFPEKKIFAILTEAMVAVEKLELKK